MVKKTNVCLKNEVFLLRLAITTNCVLNCKYCFILKTNRVMPYLTAKKTIMSFLESPGREKILIIYGGEPLLFFPLVKKIVLLAKKISSRLKKELVISLGTNGILLNEEQLEFFRLTDAKLSISLDGKQFCHDYARTFLSGEGSFKAILKNLPLIFKKIKKDNLCVLFGVLPQYASKMYSNLVYLINLGFESINIEPVKNKRFRWEDRQIKHFFINLSKFAQYMQNNLSKNNFVFLNTINRELKNKRLSLRNKVCPFFENLEVYPYGEMAFSPFLINSKDKKKYIIGNIKKGLIAKYRSCTFKNDENTCKSCWNRYADNKKNDLTNSNDLYKIRDKYSIYLANKIIGYSYKKPNFKKYIAEAKKRIFE